MKNVFIKKIISISITALIFFIVYICCIIVGEKISSLLLNFNDNNIYSFISTIVCSSGFVFIVTLLIQYIFELIPILHVKNFHRQYHIVHLIFLYISGLLAVLCAMEPILIKEKILTNPIQGEVMPLAILVFFIILSNYTLYNSLIINDDLCLNNSDDNSKVKPLSFKFIYYCFSIMLSPILLIRVCREFKMLNTNESEIGLTIILIIIIYLPYLIEKVRKTKKDNL